jgi:hypothetical protein
MKKLVLFAAAGLLIIGGVACKKSVEDVVLPSGYISYLDSALISLNPKFQKLDNDSLSYIKSVRLASGTRVSMDPEIFLNKNNSVLKTGTVSLYVKEIITKRDMMVSGILPVVDGVPVETGRQLCAYAKEGNTKVRIDNNKSIDYFIPQPAPPSAGYGVTYGATNQYATFLKWNYGTFLASNNVGVLNDSLVVTTDSLSWTNVSRPVVPLDLVRFTVNIVGPTPTKDLLQIRRYVSYDDYQTVTMSEGPIADNTYEAYGNNTKATHLVVYYIVDGKFYGGIAKITPSLDGFYSVYTSEQSPLGFFNQVALLP